MASEAEKVEVESNKSSGQDKQDDVVAIDLPAPEGWKKKFTPKKGGTPRRNEIVFISPTGEEIKNKRQLDQYLKSHSGGPSVSEFDWGTGDTPRRSARISVKSKAEETTPELEPPKKMQRKSSSKKGEKEKKGDNDEEVEAATEETKGSADREADPEETKKCAEVELKDEDDTEETKKCAEVELKDEGDVATGEAFAGNDMVKDSKQKTEITIDETTVQNIGHLEASNETFSGDKKEDDGNESLLKPGLELNDLEAEKEQAEPEAPSQVSVPNETVEFSVPEVANATGEESEVAKVGQVDHPSKETLTDSLNDQDVGTAMENHTVNCEEAPHEPKVSQASC